MTGTYHTEKNYIRMDSAGQYFNILGISRCFIKQYNIMDILTHGYQNIIFQYLLHLYILSLHMLKMRYIVWI